MERLLDVSNEFDIEVNAEKTKCTFLPCHQKAVKYITIRNKSLELRKTLNICKR